MLHELIRELRRSESLREASKRIGISHTYLDTIEKGIDKRSGSPVNPSPDTLKLISDAYNYPYEDLLLKAGYITSYQVSNRDAALLDLIKDYPELPALLTNASKDKIKAIITLLKD
ncbi:helix-turn-helix transcriptional regulator [Lederbergia citrisecunda]|uniref:helix-turn-helix domain-containing protein n=1 Tax=Lederbergia citrisecunda TaxID=2833583 RepID=UPI003D2743BF